MKISIIIPAYNCASFLPALLTKLDNQLQKGVEVIVVNDGSTDNSLEILREFKAQNKSDIIIINKENGGVSSARNTGLQVCTGEYADFIDSDDDITDDYIKTMLEALESNKDYYKKSWESFGAYGGKYDAKSLPDWNCSVWSRTIRVDKIKCMFDEKLKTAEDFKFLQENIKPDMSVGYINKHIYRYNSGRPGSLCNPIK